MTLLGSGAILEHSHVLGSLVVGVRVAAANQTVRNNVFENTSNDVFVEAAGVAALILDNEIHCPEWIDFSAGAIFYAPTNGVKHSNQPRYAAGFC